MNFLLKTALILSCSVPSFAGNFNITPYGPLPTTVPRGQSVAAIYTVTNLTSSARLGYQVVGLPYTVSQDASSAYCTNPINLQAKASCYLRLVITGPVSSNFALCKGSSCTSASTPLNVAQG